MGLVEVGEVAAVFMESRQNLPAQTVAQRQAARDLIGILREDGVLPGRARYVRARNRKEERCRRADQKISKGVRLHWRGPTEVRLKGELTEVVRRQERLDIRIAQPPRIKARLERVLAHAVAHVVGELERLRLRDARFVAADWCEPGARAE